MIYQYINLLKATYGSLKLHHMFKIFVPKYGYFGKYKDWQQAKSQTMGYDSQNILEIVTKAALAAKQGKVAYERDGVTFKNKEYSWPVLAILQVTQSHENEIKVIDFGGSLGSSYFQHNDFLHEKYDRISWNVVEQKHYVKIGNEKIANQELKFYDDLQECICKTDAKIILISGAIQYLPDPKNIIDICKKNKINNIILDRTLFIEEEKHRIAIQKVPPSIYKASYPVWMFNYNQFIAQFKPDYKIKATFDSYCDPDGSIEGVKYYHRGIWFTLNNKK